MLDGAGSQVRLDYSAKTIELSEKKQLLEDFRITRVEEKEKELEDWERRETSENESVTEPPKIGKGNEEGSKEKGEHSANWQMDRRSGGKWKRIRISILMLIPQFALHMEQLEIINPATELFMIIILLLMV